MFIFDKQRLDSLLGQLSERFEANIGTIILFFSLLLFFVLFLVVSFWAMRRREKRRLVKTYKKRTDQLFAKLHLDDEEKDLILQLSAYLKDRQKTYLLLTNQRVFYGCLQKAGENGHLGLSQFAALLKKLEFDLQEEKKKQIRRVRSTKDIAIGRPIILRFAGGDRFPASVKSNDPNSIILETSREIPPLKSGEQISLYLQSDEGIIAIGSTVIEHSVGSLVVEHSENVKKAQRRKFFRKKISIPVSVTSPDGLKFVSLLFDLGGGGASFENLNGVLSVGDDVTVDLNAGRKNPMSLDAEVVRVSRNGSVAHVYFGHLAEGDRDRIIGLVNKGAGSPSDDG